MEYIDGIEYSDRFISDEALDVLEILSYLQLVGSYDVRNRIILNYNEGGIKSSLYLRKSIRRDNIRKDARKEGKYTEESIDYDSHKKYRVDTDDITEDIVHLLLKIDNNIFDTIIDEFNIEEERKYWGYKYPTYSKCYYWDERVKVGNIGNKIKVRNENFTQISCDVMIWSEFVKIRRHRGLKLEDIFKIAIIKFLEKRYDICMKEVNGIESGYNKVWVME